ncbi:hypothetical protein ACFSSC_03070 [Corynebacterium mendelii]|uniref:Uncharacterized protein n=1 Tax=Corynebacterium mendelii TaxID=2765362 RepID=A0A939IXP0_9CORY|nr:hypothetical protein [Corynebacterium mendelii]MBN9644258.1 hypothetical protein [Corynebacterium mendelii]
MLLHQQLNPRARFVRAAGLGAVTGVVMWLALFFFDNSYYTEADGSVHGPYQPWQVIAGALIMIAVAVVCGWFLRRDGAFGAAAGAAVGLGAIVFIDFSRDDPTGLYGVGVMMITVGSFVGLALVGLIAAFISGLTRPRK